MEPLNYCPHCGAALTLGTKDRLYSRRIRPILVVVGAATIARCLPCRCGGTSACRSCHFVPEDKDFCGGCTVKFHNTTNEQLCAYYAPCGPGNADIKPRGKSEWLLDSCYKSAQVDIYTPSGQKLYSKVAGCYEWDDALIVINDRDGEYIIADTLNP